MQTSLITFGNLSAAGKATSVCMCVYVSMCLYAPLCLLIFHITTCHLFAAYLFLQFLSVQCYLQRPRFWQQHIIVGRYKVSAKAAALILICCAVSSVVVHMFRQVRLCSYIFNLRPFYIRIDYGWHVRVCVILVVLKQRTHIFITNCLHIHILVYIYTASLVCHLDALIGKNFVLYLFLLFPAGNLMYARLCH